MLTLGECACGLVFQWEKKCYLRVSKLKGFFKQAFHRCLQFLFLLFFSGSFHYIALMPGVGG